MAAEPPFQNLCPPWLTREYQDLHLIMVERKLDRLESGSLKSTSGLTVLVFSARREVTSVFFRGAGSGSESRL